MVSAIAFIAYNHFVKSNSEQIMQLKCTEKKQTMNETFLNIEQSVHTIYHFAAEQIAASGEQWQEQEWYDEHMKHMEEMLYTNAKYTEGAVSAYYRFNPEYRGEDDGLWLVLDESGQFTEVPVTDLSRYDVGDVEHVGWFYIPLERKEAVWINPYYNQSLEVEMISYVIPIVHEDRVLAVVGMDIATELLYDTTKSLRVYDTGYAFLMDSNGRFLYHPEMTTEQSSDDFNEGHAYLYEKSKASAENNTVEKYQWNNINKRLTTQELRNGMLFTVCVTDQEMNQPQRQLFVNCLLIISVMATVFILVTIQVTKTMVRLTYTDALTGLGNSTAYKECVEMMNRRIMDGEALDFAVIAIDINDLKKTNDTYGHEFGDELIKNCAAIIKAVWGTNVTYRFGGDEFAVILLNTGMEQAKAEMDAFNSEIAKFRKNNTKKEINLQMAIGASVYEASTDREYADVFRRADSAMYEDKKIKKAGQMPE